MTEVTGHCDGMARPARRDFPSADGVLFKKLIARNDNSNARASIQLLTSPDPYSRVSNYVERFLQMQSQTSNANRVLSEVRLRLLALSVAILGLVLAPLGRVG